MRRRRAFELPEGHLVVLRLLDELDEGEGVSWERLCGAAAARGIGERELRRIMHGTARADA